MEWGKEGVLHNTPENVRMGWGGGYSTLENVHMGWGGGYSTLENVHMGWGGWGCSTLENVHMGLGGERGTVLQRMCTSDGVGRGVLKFMSDVLLLPEESDCRQLLLCWKVLSVMLCRYVSVV